MISFADIFGFLGIIIGAGAWLIKDRKLLLIAAALGSAFWACHFYSIEAYTAAIVNIVIAIRTFLSSYAINKRSKIILFVFFSILFIVFSVLSWQGWISIFPMLAAINSTFAYAFLNNTNMRKFSYLSSIFWIINSIYWNSYYNILAEIIRSTFVTIGLYRIKNNNLKVN